MCAPCSWRGVVAVLLFPLQIWGGALTNPFVGQKFYVNPGNSKEFDGSIKGASGKVKENLLAMQKVPSAYWIDVKQKIKGHDMLHMQGILTDAASRKELVVLIWYDLPNRDCDAKASNGQICCTYTPQHTCDYTKAGNCAKGILEYKHTYVDPFVEVLQEFQHKTPIVVIMEPDSLPNLATNTGHPKCGNPATGAAYKEGVKYALEQVTSKAPEVTVYIDAAHGGWVGWENNLMKFMNLLQDMDLPLDKIRGFATNVANYQPLGVQCPWCPDSGYRNGFCLNNKHQSHPCCADPCKLSSQYNFGNNELNYAAGLVAAAKGVLGMDAHVIIDTGRNGVTDQRHDCANWCNPRGAGAGHPSTTKTANTSLVDAYYWLKTPGESDGCSQTLPNGETCPRFDAGCASIDSLGAGPGEEPAPEAGHWYDFQVKQLAENAQFAGSPAELEAADMGLSTCEGISGGGQPQQPQQPQQPSQPQQGSQPAPTPSSTAGTGGKCGTAFTQCGGTGWTGPSCCEEGCSCLVNGPSYSQCVPKTSGGTCKAKKPEEPPTPVLPTLPPLPESGPPTPAPTPAPVAPLTTQRPLAPAQPNLPPPPAGTFEEFIGKDCYGDGQHNAYGLAGDSSTCRALCYHAHKDCTAVVTWKTSCFFRTKKDCADRLMDAADHTVYILKERSTGVPPQAATPGAVAGGPAPSPPPFGVQPVPAAVPAGAFKSYPGMDCFSGNNAYGKVGKPETCKQECLNEHPDCVAVVTWAGLCFFRNNPLCSQNLEGARDHTTFLNSKAQPAVAQPVHVAAKEEEHFEAIQESDCFSGQNAYHLVGHPSTCQAECLHNYEDCVAVVIWRPPNERARCFFRNQPTCRAVAKAAPAHTLYIKKSPGALSANPSMTMQRDELPEVLVTDARGAGGPGEALRRSALAAGLAASGSALVAAAVASFVLLGAYRWRRWHAEVSWAGLPSSEPAA